MPLLEKAAVLTDLLQHQLPVTVRHGASKQDYNEEPGGPVRRGLRQAQGSFSEKEVARLIQQLARAVVYLHGKNVVHRDQAREHSTWSEPRSLLCDFGWSAHCPNHMPCHEICGTREYLAPEVTLLDEALRGERSSDDEMTIQSGYDETVPRNSHVRASCRQDAL